MPKWIEEGFNEYARRMPPDFKLELIELPALKRGNASDVTRAVRQEGEQMLAAIPPSSFVIALDVKGQQWDTPQLASHLQQWREQGQSISLLIGGPEGLTQSCLDRANKKWSLSLLTFPHPLVRVIVAEQLYRAWSILSHHPYHRN
ncbi:MAG: 23S rRNA (pseudouridine(1915)-N(3))-methyltransferase RlmH [Gammaproteobacteria bacterium]|nr:23S rRNA (pseudouridine(1915)-N(3))-methyltransferase RlmH [Gammaproteobacteria bacterium]